MATTAVSFPLAFIRVAPTQLIIAAVMLVTLAYFAVADWLYMARLAGYLCIAEMPEALAESATLPAPPPPTSIDREELILSDIPNLAVET
jgi:endonuclease/exonuclease/phosphatase (EEP) superfamily protein YafD